MRNSVTCFIFEKKNLLKNIRPILSILFMLAFLTLPTILFAQDPGCDPLDPACPIDGGLSLLIAAGIGIAGKKAYENRKKK